MKTIKEWLETIADPTIREAAISQIDESNSMWPEDGMAKSLADALLSFNDWDKTKELRIHWRNISNLALRGQLETREVEAPKIKEGYIPYSNEQEREWAIAQAERMGAKEWKINQEIKGPQDRFIYVGKDVNTGDGYWFDKNDYDPHFNTLIPLERPEEATKLETKSSIKVFGEAAFQLKENDDAFTYGWNSNKYTKTEQEDGTIILKPKKVKVWIEVYKTHSNKMETLIHFNKQQLEDSINDGKNFGETLLEVIEREYEI